MTFHEHEFEPVRGLPGPLPEGEEILWQGAPRWRSLFRHACYLRSIAVYFGIILVWQVVTALYDGGGVSAALGRAFWVVLLWAALTGLLGLYSWLVGRTSVYTITNRRLVLRIGVALPITLNLPFKVIESAGVRVFRDGTGDLPITVRRPSRVAFLVLWPHARPWRISHPYPMLRSVPEAQRVAEILGNALNAAEALRQEAEAGEEIGAEVGIGEDAVRETAALNTASGGPVPGKGPGNGGPGRGRRSRNGRPRVARTAAAE